MGIPIERSRHGEEDEEQQLRSAVKKHSIAEKKRRQRLKGKIRTLQELIPHHHKNDTASILEETINYIHMLQFQAQCLQGHYMSSVAIGNSQHQIIFPLVAPMIPQQRMQGGSPARFVYGFNRSTVLPSKAI